MIKIYTVFKGTNRKFTGTKKEIAEHFNINYSTFKGRLQMGYSLEESIDFISHKNGYIKYTVFEGTSKEFTGNIRELADHFNIGYYKLKDRMKKYSTIEECLDTTSKRCKIYTVFKDTDREFTGTLDKIAEHFNINIKTIKNRIYSKHHYTLEEAINWKNKRKQIFTVFKNTDKEFTGTRYKILQHFNIPINVYQNLKDRYSLEDIIDGKYSDLRYEIYTVFRGTNREFTGNKTEIEKHFGLGTNVLSYRMNATNCSFEEAIDWNGGKFKIYTVFENTDKEFKGNITKICKYFNKSIDIIRYRLKCGYNIEEAITIPLKQVRINNLNYKGTKMNLKEICKLENKNFIEVYNKLRDVHTLKYSLDSTTKSYVEDN